MLGTEYRKTPLGASWPVKRLLKRRKEEKEKKEENKRRKKVIAIIKARY